MPKHVFDPKEGHVTFIQDDMKPNKTKKTVLQTSLCSPSIKECKAVLVD